MNKIMINNLSIAYIDEGAGKPVLLLHCSSSSHKEWTHLIGVLKTNYRVIAPDLPGYGNSESRLEDKNTDALSDIEVIGELLKLTGQPTHIIAHSYGAALALEATKSFSLYIAGLVLVEPVSFHLLRSGGHSEWHAVDHMARQVIKAVDTKNYTAAARIFMSFWTGYLKWFLMPGKKKKYVIRTIVKVAAEIRSVYKDHTSIDSYRFIRLPITLIVGERTRKPAKKVIEILESLLPHAEIKTIHGAGHMSPYTHRDAVIQLAIDHLHKYSNQSVNQGCSE